MDKIVLDIYRKLISFDHYDTSHDLMYQKTAHELVETEKEIIRLLRKSLPKEEVKKLTDKYQNLQNQILFHEEYRDFLNFFTAGLSIGLMADKEKIHKYQELFDYLNNRL